MPSSTLDNFLELLFGSGLPQDRIEYYLDRIKTKQFNEEDQQSLLTELQLHVAQLDETIEGMEEIIASKQAQYEEDQKEILPYVQKIAEMQPEIQKQELEDFKQELSQADKEFMQKLEHIRNKKTEQQMAALQNFLKEKR